MSAAIAIFAKTPRLSPVKTRLAADIGEDKAQAFYHLSIKAVQAVVASVNAALYWAVAEENGLSDPLWQGFATLWTGEGGLGERQHHIYETLLQRHDRVLLIGSDAPQISKAVLEDAIAKLDTNDFVIGPARDGGYFLFGGKVSTEQSTWTSVPWSTSVTKKRLEAGLPSKPDLLPQLTDVDTLDDLQYIRQEMPEDMNREQKHMLEWIKNFELPDSLHG